MIKVTIPNIKFKLGIKKEIQLEIFKTMGNQLVVKEHPEVDIVVIPENNKILVLPKDLPTNEVYDVQNKFFNLLRREGIVEPDSIRSGFVYGSMEGQMFINENVDMVQVAILGIDQFMKEERPHYEYVENFEKQVDSWITEPTDEDSTALGEVPEEPTKGSIRPGWIRGPYGMSILSRT